MALKLYHVPGTRSVRTLWLCYELELDVVVEVIDFSEAYRASDAWRSISPAGKIPVLVDGGVTVFESGAIVEYILEKYGNGRLKPAAGSPESALCYQWMWFSEATLIRPLGLYRTLRNDTDAALLVAEAREKFFTALQVVEDALQQKQYLLGDAFSAADIMMGYSIAMVERLLNEDFPHCKAYLDRLRERTALIKVLEYKPSR